MFFWTHLHWQRTKADTISIQIQASSQDSSQGGSLDLLEGAHTVDKGAQMKFIIILYGKQIFTRGKHLCPLAPHWLRACSSHWDGYKELCLKVGSAHDLLRAVGGIRAEIAKTSTLSNKFYVRICVQAKVMLRYHTDPILRAALIDSC